MTIEIRDIEYSIGEDGLRKLSIKKEIDGEKHHYVFRYSPGNKQILARVLKICSQERWNGFDFIDAIALLSGIDKIMQGEQGTLGSVPRF
ncbi:hypothetical protein HYV50_02125 [Candidatus Pacearchaeota archaeon]|nr:hypothetical protein [Candidatus Pacearchaeota archaeon]